MPVHDWTRVNAGTFHDFHCTWTPEIKNRLNEGLLPPAYYAQVEQVAGEMTADILTLHEEPAFGTEELDEGGGPATAVATLPPKVRFTAELEIDTYAARARRVVIRHSSDDRIVALIEVLSPGNKSSRPAFRTFLNKAVTALRQGCHLLLIDLLPPGPARPPGHPWRGLGRIGREPVRRATREAPDPGCVLRRSEEKGLRGTAGRGESSHLDALILDGIHLHPGAVGRDVSGGLSRRTAPVARGA